MTAGLVAFRFLHFSATAVLVGGGGLSWLMGSQRPSTGKNLLRVATVGAGVSGLGWLALTLTNVTGADDAVVHRQDWIDFMTSPFGPPWAILACLSLAACVLVAWIGPRVALGLGVSLTIDQAWLGHAAAVTGAAAIAAYVVHVLAGFSWIGALIMLWACRHAPETWRAGLAIVSNLGLVVVALIIASGALNAAEHIGTVGDLVATAYGRILLAKIALVAAMLALAAVNRREVKGKSAGSRSLAVRVGMETLIGLAILGLAAVLGITEPPA